MGMVVAIVCAAGSIAAIILVHKAGKLDLIGNGKQGLNVDEISKLKNIQKPEKKMPAKKDCPNCNATVLVEWTKCPECGYFFE
jgi:hypothetical protein